MVEPTLFEKSAQVNLVHHFPTNIGGTKFKTSWQNHYLYMKETHPDLTRESAPLRSAWLPCGTILRSQAKKQKKAGRWGKKSIHFGKMHGLLVCFVCFVSLLHIHEAWKNGEISDQKLLYVSIAIYCCLLAKNIESWCICVTSCCWKSFFGSGIWLYSWCSTGQRLGMQHIEKLSAIPG